MQHFKHILFPSQAVRKQSGALQQGLQLIQENKAKLTIAVFQPETPKALSVYQESIQAAMTEAIHKEIDALCRQYAWDSAALTSDIAITLLRGQHFASESIRFAMRNNCDIVIKDVEDVEKGLHAVDMAMLRKCPLPVWLCRDSHQNVLGREHIAVAIDPLSEEPAGRDLAIELLKVSASLSERRSATLHLLSCWDCKWERWARQNAFVSIPDSEVNAQVEEARAGHAEALESLIAASGIEAPALHIKKGKAETLIPAMLEDIGASTIVMGTVARTGIPGFVIGNTAESIVQRVQCSVLAAKPNGFVSPVEAY